MLAISNTPRNSRPYAVGSVALTKQIALSTESTHEASRMADLAPDFIVVDPQVIASPLLSPRWLQV
jgi:hypothetical protein